MTTRHPASDRWLRPTAAGLPVLTCVLLLAGCHAMPPAAVVDGRTRVPPRDRQALAADSHASTAHGEPVRTVAFESPEAAAVPSPSDRVGSDGSRSPATLSIRDGQPPAPARAEPLPVPSVPGSPVASCPPGLSAGGCYPSPMLDAGPFVWSPNEYLCDGGDAFPPVDVARDWRVFGLNLEDAVAHYDTLDGKTNVQPSNRVCIYAPRFAAVRQVTGVVLHEQHEGPSGIIRPVGPVQSGTAELATTVLQPVEPRGQRATKFGQTFRERTRTAGVENRQTPAAAENELLAYEEFRLLRQHQLDNTEKARLAARLEAAIVWTHEKAVQVVIDEMPAVEVSEGQGLQSVYTFQMPKGKPRLCLAKCASTDTAKPGDLVKFTLRFENVGDQVIGNVTILDNLSPRLEYVPDSQQCSLAASFSTSDNDGESLLLRWEISQPLEVGEGGVIHFQCRVR